MWALILVAEGLTLKSAAGNTDRTLTKFVPVMMICVSVPKGMLFGATAVTVVRNTRNSAKNLPL